MAELIILAAMSLSILFVTIWPRIAWADEDWRHLRLPDSYDPDASRGRVRSAGGAWRVVE